MTKNILRGVTLAAISAVALAGCGTHGAFKATDYGATGRLTPEQSASSRTTRNYMVEIYSGLDEDGHVLPQRDLTLQESVALAEIDQHCAGKVAEVEGVVMERARIMGTFGVTGLVSQTAGALGVPNADLESYASLGTGSFLGSGAATAQIKLEQAFTILHATCMTHWVTRSPLLNDMMIYPVLAGRAVRPRMGTENSETAAEREARYEREDREAAARGRTTQTIPIIPIT